jgi:hypothetical protein
MLHSFSEPSRRPFKLTTAALHFSTSANDENFAYQHFASPKKTRIVSDISISRWQDCFLFLFHYDVWALLVFLITDLFSHFICPLQLIIEYIYYNIFFHSYTISHASSSRKCTDHIAVITRTWISLYYNNTEFLAINIAFNAIARLQIAV